MKRILVLAISLFLVFSQTFAISVISGKWKDPLEKKVSLYEVKNGELKEVATSTISEDDDFGFVFNPKTAGFYVIGTSPSACNRNLTFYLKPNDNLSIEMDGFNSYTLSGENTPENKLMEQWHNIIRPLNAMAFTMDGTYVQFFPLLEEKMEIIAKTDWTKNCPPEFSTSFEKFRTLDLMQTAIIFIYSPRRAHPQGEDFPDYYQELSLAKYTSTDHLLDYPYGLSLLRLLRLRVATVETEGKDQKERAGRMSFHAALDADLPNIVSKNIKAYLILNNATSVKTYPGFLDYEKHYGKYLLTEEQRLRMKEISKNLVENTKGSPAFDFSFEDINGKQVTLASMKGKVVYIDIWATWCKPCLNEIPSLKKLEEEYKGKNVVFVSISIDAQKDHKKWKDFVVKEQLGGVQLYAGSRSKEIQDPYGIKSIPAFLLIGADGNLISGNAPRPSSDEIRPLLNSALK